MLDQYLNTRLHTMSHSHGACLLAHEAFSKFLQGVLQACQIHAPALPPPSHEHPEEELVPPGHCLACWMPGVCAKHQQRWDACRWAHAATAARLRLQARAAVAGAALHCYRLPAHPSCHCLTRILTPHHSSLPCRRLHHLHTAMARDLNTIPHQLCKTHADTNSKVCARNMA